jgi:hypothetical protein
MKFGNILDQMRWKYAKAWKIGLFVFLAAIVAVNFSIRPHEAEYRFDIYPGFWAAFGLSTTVLMVWIMKKVIQPRIKRPEEGNDE